MFSRIHQITSISDPTTFAETGDYVFPVKYEITIFCKNDITLYIY